MALQLGSSSKSKQALAAQLPDECWLKVFTHLEATELAGCASRFCTSALALANHPKLWESLLQMDFCASLAQRSLLKTWMEMHGHFHPRQLYIYKRGEHTLDLDIARAELHQRTEQAREQEKKHRRLRTLNFVFVRMAHLLLCGAVLASSILLWLRLDKIAVQSFYVVFAPVFAFEVFVFMSALVAFAIYFLRGSSGWTFYWNRLRGVVRWLILYTSPGEGIIVLLSASSVVPLLACALEGDFLLPKQYPQFTLPFVAFWLTSLFLAGSLVRRRSFSRSCVGAYVFIWLPLLSVSIWLFLRLSVWPETSPFTIFAPSLAIVTLAIALVSFLVAASFWLGCRGSSEWTEYATITLLTLPTLLLPLLLFQIAIIGYLNGYNSVDLVFLPWVLWLSCLFVFTLWYTCMPLGIVPPAAQFHRLTRSWRQHSDSQSDMEQLLALQPE